MSAQPPVTVACQECRRVSDEAWRGWRAYRGDESDGNTAPVVVFYCPECAEREFGPLRAQRRPE